MSKISQKDAVYSITKNILNEKGIHFEDGQDVKLVMNKEVRKIITQALIISFKEGVVTYEGDLDDQSVKNYACQVISNWYKKDTRLNGSTVYNAKPTTSRVGANNPTVKELRRMLKRLKGTKYENAINQELAKQLVTIQATKASINRIDKSLLPDEFKHLVK